MKRENRMNRKRWNWKKRLGISALLVMVLCIAGFMIYTFDYYKTTISIEQLENTYRNLTFEREGNVLQIVQKEPENMIGIILYPGGKVDSDAYASLMVMLANEGYQCFIADMPFHLAVFGQNAAASIMEAHSEIEEWYLCGHSLGGAMAASYTAGNPEQIDGLILLAAYGTKDLSDNGVPVVSIYGTKDLVLNKDNFNKYKKNLPEDTMIMEIIGGNHAGFGTYGDQKGDGTAAVPAKKQQMSTTAEIVRFIEDEDKQLTGNRPIGEVFAEIKVS